jgi:hypothetical protein
MINQNHWTVSQIVKSSNGSCMMPSNSSRQMGNLKTLLFIAGLLMTQCVGRSEIPSGNWAFSGTIQDPIGNVNKTFAVNGHYSDGGFIFDLTPITEPNGGTESMGWDGKLLCEIARWAVDGGPRTNCAAVVEPSVFSYRASYACSPVLMALADNNQLANLEQQKTRVIINNRRIYPEENNTYKIAYAQTNSNSTEIEAICPGIQIGRSGLEPIPGFERGFTRWKFKSSIVSTNERDGSWKLSLKYDEFVAKLRKPTNKQIQTRSVTAEILFQPEDRPPSSFRPLITERQLPVDDYTSRNDLFPWTKGQYDWWCHYYFTNQQWDFPTDYINAEVSDIKLLFAKSHGLPQEILDSVNTDKSQPVPPLLGGRRMLTIGGMVGISAISAALFWFVARSGKTANKK